VYLREILVLNSGALDDFSLNANFHLDGTPKPIVLVGSNGSGKTTIISIIADALIEIAALKLQGVTPTQGMARKFFRVLGGRSIRLSTKYEVCAARFEHDSDQFFYRSKSGEVAAKDLLSKMAAFGPAGNFKSETIETGKIAFGPAIKVPSIFHEGAYAFFPANRFELPFWMNADLLAHDPPVGFAPLLSDHLRKPVMVQTAFSEMKSWIMGLLADSGINVMEVLALPNHEAIRSFSEQKLASTAPALSGLSAILSAVLRRPARISRLLRGQGDQRICIASGSEVVVPTLENLSAGQASLLSIFGTILRYGDDKNIPPGLAVEGVVLIDEVDAHLHSDLQHDVLPSLIRLFPRIQFILSSHSPLFPLGMAKLFGEDGFSLIEMPSGTAIDVERFSEFESSFAHFQATKTFEQKVKEQLTQGKVPLVLCEGETDPKYLKTAAELLGFTELTYGVHFDWVGQKTATGESQGAGQSHLDNARRFLVNNPQFLGRAVVLLYDCDTQKDSADLGNLFVRRIARNEGNSVTDRGIENLLPDEVFEQHFYSEKTIQKGADRTIVRQLKKLDLCDHLCGTVRDPKHFTHFRGILDELRNLLKPSAGIHTPGSANA
jgi:hypothetical protein